MIVTIWRGVSEATVVNSVFQASYRDSCRRYFGSNIAAAIDVRRCETADLYARLASAASEDDLLIMARLFSGEDGPSACSTLDSAPGPAPLPAAMVIPVWKKPAVEPAPLLALPAATDVQQPFTKHTAALIAQVQRERNVIPPPAPVIEATTFVKQAPEGPATPVAISERPAPDARRADTVRALQAAAAALTQAAEAMKPRDIPTSEQ